MSDNPMRDKICLVCGDRALGYNFNAVTCESCKAFFRRNALKDKTFKCPFNEKCKINTVTRRFCQYCRLSKCFDVGMKKEYIMTEQDKQKKRNNVKHKKETSDSVVSDSCDVAEIDEYSDEIACKKMKYMAADTVLRDSQPPGQDRKLSAAPDSCPKNMEHTLKEKDPYPDNSGIYHVPEKASHKIEKYPMEPETVHYNSEQNNSLVMQLSPPSKVDLNGSIDLRRYPKERNYMEQGSSSDSALLTSPNLFEPSSPVGSALAGSSRYSDGPRSRSVEIYQMSKAYDSPKTTRADYCDRNKPKNVICIGAFDVSHEKMIPAQSSKTDRSMPLLSSLMNTQSRTYHDRSFQSEVSDEVFNDIPNRNDQVQMGHSIDSILTEAIKLEYEAYSSMNPRINSRELNDAERAKLNELIVANKALLAPLEDDVSTDMTQAISKDDSDEPMLVDVLNLTAVAIRRLIKMSKKINAFKNMCQEDQVALLKGGCTEMMILRSAMTYDSDRGSWKIPQSAEKLMNIKVDVLKEAGGRVFDEHQRFLQTFDPKWRNDENIMLILSAITLFTPHRPKVVHHDVIKLEQNSYYYLLRRYLESIYPGCEARSTFLQLIQKISELHRLNEDHVRVYMDLNPKDVEPLLIEIFDLKH